MCQCLRGIASAQKLVFDQRLGNHHKQCGGDSLAGDIRDDQRQMIIINQEEIVEIAADFLGRIHGCKEFKLLPIREGRKYTGQRIELDSAGQVQFCPDAFFFRGGPFDSLLVLCQVLLHTGHNPGQVFQFISCLNSDGRKVIRSGDAVLLIPDICRGGFRNGIDRVGYSSLHMPACDKSKQEGERQHEAADIESIMDNLLCDTADRQLCHQADGVPALSAGNV